MEILREIQTKMTVRKTRPIDVVEHRHEDDPIFIFMSMFNDVDWTVNGNYTECFSNSEMVRDHARKIPLRQWSFKGPGEEEKWCGMQNYTPEGQWNTAADVTVANFKDSGHLFFRASSALDRGFLKKKGGRCTIHFSADPSNAELLSRSSIYGAIADWCDELTQQILGQSFFKH